MLTLTPDATQAIHQLLSTTDTPAGAGIRIESTGATQSSNGAEAEGGGLRVVVASEAPGGDEVVEHEGARVFIEPVVSDFVDDKQLDITPAEGGMAFMLVEQ